MPTKPITARLDEQDMAYLEAVAKHHGLPSANAALKLLVADARKNNHAALLAAPSLDELTERIRKAESRGAKASLACLVCASILAEGNLAKRIFSAGAAGTLDVLWSSAGAIASHGKRPTLESALAGGHAALVSLERKQDKLIFKAASLPASFWAEAVGEGRADALTSSLCAFMRVKDEVEDTLALVGVIAKSRQLALQGLRCEIVGALRELSIEDEDDLQDVVREHLVFEDGYGWRHPDGAR